MVKVRVMQHIAGSLDDVFDLMSDHETFLSRFPGTPTETDLGVFEKFA